MNYLVTCKKQVMNTCIQECLADASLTWILTSINIIRGEFQATIPGDYDSGFHPLPKKKRIQCGSNPGPLDYEWNTLPLKHAGPHIKVTAHIIQLFSGFHHH